MSEPGAGEDAAPGAEATSAAKTGRLRAHLPGAELAVFAVATAVYSILAAPGVGWMDAGELTAAAWTLGGAHPPGHAVHSLLGKLAALVPLGEIGTRLGLLSAVSMAAALAGVVAVARRLAPERDRRVATLAGVVGAALAGLSPAALVNATRAEVYAPAAALLLWSLAAVLTFTRPGRGAGDPRALLLAALGCGLAAAFHPVIAAAAALPMILAAGLAARRRLVRLAGPAVALGLLALASYAYLPLRAGAAEPPLLVWGDPSTPGRFLDLVTAVVYQGNFAVGGVLERFAGMWLLTGEWTGLGLLLGGLIGLALGAITRLRGAGLALAVVTATLAGAALQDQLNPDLRGYALPAVLVLAAGLAPLVAAALRLLPEGLAAAGSRAALVAAGAVLVPLAAVGLLAGGPPALERDDGPLRLWGDTVARMPPGPGLYYASGDHSLFAAQYERLVAGGRPDIAIASAELARDEWFVRHIKALLPELYVPFVDDGVRGAVPERLAVSNMRNGRPVGGDHPSFGRLSPRNARPIGRGFLYLLEPGDTPAGEEVPAPLDLRGAIGRRVAALFALSRADYEAQRGRFAAAARAAGLDRTRFSPAEMAALAEAQPRPDRPGLLGFVPRRTRIVLHEPWVAALFADDLAWRGGLEVPPPPAGAPPERRIHATLRAVLAGDLAPGSPALLDLGPEVAVTTSRLLAELGGEQALETHLRALIERWPEDGGSVALLGSLAFNRGDLAEAEELLRRATKLAPAVAEGHARLSVVLARRGKLDEARAAWQRATSIDPSVASRLPPPDVAAGDAPAQAPPAPPPPP